MVQGLGDVIEKVTKSVGIEPCENCIARKNKLNKLFPFKNNLQFTSDELEFMADFVTWYKGLPIPIDKVDKILEAERIWMRVFNIKTDACRSCGAQYQKAFIKDLLNLYASKS